MLPSPRSMPALITPFDRAGEIDLAAHRHNLGILSEKGIKGFLLAGSTGEGPYLEPGERYPLVSAARKTLGRRATVICGVAAETTRLALRLIAEAADGGADAVLVMTPTTLVRSRIQYVESFYLAVADASPVPVYLYTVPAVTAFSLPEASITRLAANPNIVGIKDSSGDPLRMQRLLPTVPPEFELFTGSSQALSQALGAGAYGAITASTNYLPELVQRIVRSARRNPVETRALQAQLSAIAIEVESHGIPGVKVAAEIAGLRAGLPRLPLEPLAARLRRDIEALFATI
ncbi:MAG: dihydrodipicolinate synthase family protein [Acidimicrobiia bacterium]